MAHAFRGPASAYSDVPEGQPLALFGSSGHLEIAVRNGHAARQLGLRVGDTVLLAQEKRRESRESNGMAALTFGPIAYAERPWRRDPATAPGDGDIYAATPDERAQTVQAAFDAGIRLFHAAHEREAVSLGASLRTLGLRDQIILSTTDGDALDRCPDTEAGGEAAIAAAIARKRELLGVEAIDLFLLHDFRPETHTPRRLAGGAARPGRRPRRRHGPRTSA